MKYLLDTRVLLWWYLEPKKLSSAALSVIKNKTNQVYVSDAVVWEIVIKVSNEKLSIPRDFFSETEKDFEILPINTKHIYRISSLEKIHKDPFDRLLIAQSLEENIPIVTRDQQILKYKTQLIEA